MSYIHVMSRSRLFQEITRALRIARLCNDRGLSTSEGLARAREREVATGHAAARHSRREWLKTVAHAGALFAVQRRSASLDVGIVGAGLAGLACADALAANGVAASVYDAATRAGGRCFSLRNFFPGQVVENGGEFIDNPHKTMLGYARRFGLQVEDVTKLPGDVTYHFAGRNVAESVVVDEFREFVAAMRTDLRRLSNEVTALSHTPFDRAVDRTNLLAYLEGANGSSVPAGPIAKAAISEAYIAEFGLEPDEQSCLNFLLFIHADRRSKFTPFGVFSDERYHVVDGNDRIVSGLAQALPRPVQFGMSLIAARRTPGGRIELTFDTPAGTVSGTHDTVVLAVPFSTLRQVTLDDNLGIPAAQRTAIDQLGYGSNAKMMVGFVARPWAARGGNGSSYSDLAHHQTTWETNPARAGAANAVLTDYSGGDRGAALDPGTFSSRPVGSCRISTASSPAPRPRHAASATTSSRTSSIGRRIR